MSWQTGNGFSWYEGTGLYRIDVVGPCRCLLPNGATHVQKKKRLKSVLGITWSEGNIYVAGTFDPTVGFYPLQAVDQSTYDQCWGAINCTSERPQVGTEAPQHNATTPTGQDFDWKLAIAAILILIALIIALT